MVRLNSSIPLHRNSTNDESRNNGGLIPKKVTFFGLLGTTIAALKLKKQWDEYQSIPTEPTAANHPIAPPAPAYRDDDCDTESAIGLDTTIAVPTRIRRKRNCCMCCGINCGLFCKALGIVILIFTVWNCFKLAKWLLTPSPTGLENMPEFSTSLGCLDAPHFYQDSSDGAFYTIPVGDDVDHDLFIDGGAVGTVILKPSTSIGESSVKVLTSVRTSDSRLLNNVEVHTPDVSPVFSSGSTSYFRLVTPIEGESANACMRYDLTVYLPPNLRTLRVVANSVAQVKVDFGDVPRELHLLRVDLKSSASANLVLPSAELLADDVDIKMRGGYLVGTLPIANSTRVDTRRGDAITKLDLFTSGYALPEPDEETRDDLAVAHLTTLTGTGRSDFAYDNRAVRPIKSEHASVSLGSSELRLTYEKARFNGKIDVEARSYSMRNVQSDGFGSKPGDRSDRWVGDKDGGDYLKVSTPGWVGIYF